MENVPQINMCYAHNLHIRFLLKLRMFHREFFILFSFFLRFVQSLHLARTSLKASNPSFVTERKRKREINTYHFRNVGDYYCAGDSKAKTFLAFRFEI